VIIYSVCHSVIHCVCEQDNSQTQQRTSPKHWWVWARGDHLKLIKFWFRSGFEYGCRISFLFSLILADTNVLRYNDIHQGWHCNILIRYSILYNMYSVTRGRQCGGLGGVCALWVLLLCLCFGSATVVMFSALLVWCIFKRLTLL